MKRLKDLGDKESANILEIEEDENRDEEVELAASSLANHPIPGNLVESSGIDPVFSLSDVPEAEWDGFLASAGGGISSPGEVSRS